MLAHGSPLHGVQLPFHSDRSCTLISNVLPSFTVGHQFSEELTESLSQGRWLVVAWSIAHLLENKTLSAEMGRRPVTRSVTVNFTALICPEIIVKSSSILRPYVRCKLLRFGEMRLIRHPQSPCSRSGSSFADKSFFNTTKRFQQTSCNCERRQKRPHCTRLDAIKRDRLQVCLQL
jgi:hypothetical protein